MSSALRVHERAGDAKPTRCIPQEVRDLFLSVCDRTLSEGAIGNREKAADVIRKIEYGDKIYAPIPSTELKIFNKIYYNRNLLKFIILLYINKPFISSRSTHDIGCGAGVATIAWRAVLPPRMQAAAMSVCVDRDLGQLSVASKTISRAFPTAARPVFRRHFTRVPASCATLYSYSICELIADGYDYREIYENSSSSIIALDYAQILIDFFEEIRKDVSKAAIVTEKYELDDEIASIVGKSYIGIAGLYAKK